MSHHLFPHDERPAFIGTIVMLTAHMQILVRDVAPPGARQLLMDHV